MLFKVVGVLRSFLALVQNRKFLLIWFFLVPLGAHAEEPKKVFAGEYILSRALYSAAASSSKPRGEQTVDVLAQTMAKSEGLYQDVSLVRSNVAAAVSSEIAQGEIVAYDEQAHREFCALARSLDPAITVCDPNFVIEIEKSANDLQSSLWGLPKMKADSAWDVSTGSRNVVVAVVDTGVDYTHPDLVGNMWTNPGEVPGNGLDDDGNGVVDDYYGVNALGNTGDPRDDNGHGTHCAGTIGARGNNGLGVVGVNWEVSIMGVKFLSANGAGSMFGAIAGINYAVRNGADIISASWGGGGYSQSLYDAIKAARDAGVLFVAAAGNSGLNTDIFPNYPSAFVLENIISVAASGQKDTIASFSNYGQQSVDIAAPGVGILSTVPGGYASFSGTSMATPHVAGAAALLKAVSPELGFADLKARLLNGADVVSELAPYVPSGRRLNAYAALFADGNPPPNTQPDEPAADEMAILHLSGSNGQSFLTVGKSFSLVVGGDPGASAQVTVRFRSGSATLGKCSLGSVTVGQGGSTDITGVIKLKGPSKFARSVAFSVAASAVRRKLRGSRSGANSRYERRVQRRYARQSCALIGASLAVVSR